jgi:hypothetical protein
MWVPRGAVVSWELGLSMTQEGGETLETLSIHTLWGTETITLNAREADFLDGLPPPRAATTFRFRPSPSLAVRVLVGLLAGAGLAPLAIMGWAAWPFVALALLALLVSYALMTGPIRVVVSDDGLAVVRATGQRFAHLRDIVRVTHQAPTKDTDGFVSIRLCNGERLRLREEAGTWRDLDGSETERLVAFLEGRIPPPEEREFMGFERNGRPLPEWVSALRTRVRVANNDYRIAATFDEEPMWRIVENSYAPDDARVGAAYVLMQSAADDTTRNRLLALAERDQTNTDFSQALRAIAQGDDDWETKLERLSSD